MIGKIIIGSGFKGVISYCLSPKKGLGKQIERSEIIDYNQCFGTKNELIRQFTDVRNLNTKLNKPVIHFILSFSISDSVNNSLLSEISNDLAKDFGFDKNQYIVIRHTDTEDTHPHIHVIANRVGFDKKTVSDSNSYKRIAEFARKQELKHSLQQVLSPNSFLPKQERKERNDERKLNIKNQIKLALTDSQTLEQFRISLQAKGIRFETGRGITFGDDKIQVKGSKLGYSFEKVKNCLKTNIMKQMPIEQRTKQLSIGL